MQAGPAYAEAFLSVVRNVTKEDTVQYVLALLDDMLSGQSIKSAQAFTMFLFPCDIVLARRPCTLKSKKLIKLFCLQRILQGHSCFTSRAMHRKSRQRATAYS